MKSGNHSVYYFKTLSNAKFFEFYALQSSQKLPDIHRKGNGIVWVEKLRLVDISNVYR